MLRAYLQSCGHIPPKGVSEDLPQVKKKPYNTKRLRQSSPRPLLGPQIQTRSQGCLSSMEPGVATVTDAQSILVLGTVIQNLFDTKHTAVFTVQCSHGNTDPLLTNFHFPKFLRALSKTTIYKHKNYFQLIHPSCFLWAILSPSKMHAEVLGHSTAEYTSIWCIYRDTVEVGSSVTCVL